MKTQLIDTMSIAPTDFDDLMNHDFLVPYMYLDGLRTLRAALMDAFVESGNIDLYNRAQSVSKRITLMLNK